MIVVEGLRVVRVFAFRSEVRVVSEHCWLEWGVLSWCIGRAFVVDGEGRKSRESKVRRASSDAREDVEA